MCGEADCVGCNLCVSKGMSGIGALCGVMWCTWSGNSGRAVAFAMS